MMSKSKAPSANDQRANAKNPNNPAYQHALDNHSRQLNPNDPAYESSRSDGGESEAEPNSSP
jgi:hypothetical protein